MRVAVALCLSVCVTLLVVGMSLPRALDDNEMSLRGGQWDAGPCVGSSDSCLTANANAPCTFCGEDCWYCNNVPIWLCDDVVGGCMYHFWECGKKYAGNCHWDVQQQKWTCINVTQTQTDCEYDSEDCF